MAESVVTEHVERRPPVFARYRSKCRFCEKRFVPGKDLIEPLEPYGWIHEGCADALTQFPRPDRTVIHPLLVEFYLPPGVESVTEAYIEEAFTSVAIETERNEKGLRVRLTLRFETEPDVIAEMGKIVARLQDALHLVGPVDKLVIGMEKGE